MKPVAWEAEDGTVFKDEAECAKYEETCRKKKALKSRFYREDGLQLFPEIVDEDDLYHQCWYIYIANEEEVDFVNKLLDTTNLTMPGIYLYDDEYGRFRHLSELYAQIQKAVLSVKE